MKKSITVANCDHCGEAIYKGEKVQLCEDGGVVHNRCLMEYAMKLAAPISINIDEITNNCA
ncbi:DUF2175 family protein [Geosporobacter ferrireducens]|uniref:RING-type domain-containing protein n=1 Tax=Geosporobacter ferrireducens TaxID=1424294 RepID=A0A1D8GBW4_9FIRM|nr:DUF2175 family protein [Geosporobacter ferrireducens]AOT68370.1 hypothetical protein Gferi_01430 [Geosporobacter ferrireducens]MTI53815.1 DUF2175 domain-containing protein [Geosporobacter ferrireducens]